MINVAPPNESKWNGIRLFCSSDAKPENDFYLAMASRRAALSGNASLIATFLTASPNLLGTGGNNLN